MEGFTPGIAGQTTARHFLYRVNERKPKNLNTYDFSCND